MGLTFSIVLVTVSLSHRSYAQSCAPWHLINSLAGRIISTMDILRSSPDTMYAAGQDLFRSSNYGRDWDSLEAFGQGILKVDPFNSNVMYVTGPGRHLESDDVWMTRNGGLSWTLIASGSVFQTDVIEIDPTDHKTVYVGAGPSRLYKSTDQGTSWTLLPASGGSGLFSLSVSPANPQILYAGYVSQLYKSNDGGNSWSELTMSHPFGNRITPIAHPSDTNIVYVAAWSYDDSTGGIFKSSDGGLTWEERNIGLETLPRTIYCFALNPKRSEELYLGFINSFGSGGGLLFKSTDRASNWIECSDSLPSDGYVASIVIDTSLDRTYVAMYSLNHSLDGVYVQDEFLASRMEIQSPVLDSHLYPPYPNPTNSTAVIRFKLATAGSASLTIYNLLGERMTQLVSGEQSPGEHSISLSDVNLPSGIYFVELRARRERFIQKLLMMK